MIFNNPNLIRCFDKRFYFRYYENMNYFFYYIQFKIFKMDESNQSNFLGNLKMFLCHLNLLTSNPKYNAKVHVMYFKRFAITTKPTTLL